MEQLTHSTVRIETELRGGGVSTGTGFFMNFMRNGNNCVPVIVTNKHVIRNSEVGRFHVTLATDAGLPSRGQHQQFQFPGFEGMCINHPDPAVDLAAFPIGPILNDAQQRGVPLFYVPLDVSLIPGEEEREGYSSMEDVVMIGYPNGIWDEVNNLPIIRKGITASHPGVAWNGKREFLTDIASFPGSSGSPVFLANLGGYMDKAGNTFMGSHRIRLLGVHYAGALHTASGQIRIVTAPTSNVPVPITQIPNNIGVAINSLEVLGLEREVERMVGGHKQTDGASV
ncbi:serine protease [Stenotrophomonas sp.]|uniref:S1 family peptidase n=1 Tax=Stenotrophomonas sp. TaxID=69392 RepID=UPI0028ADA23C|nr:serine protease [Stenotrophomonas sp.]